LLGKNEGTQFVVEGSGLLLRFLVRSTALLLRRRLLLRRQRLLSHASTAAVPVAERSVLKRDLNFVGCLLDPTSSTTSTLFPTTLRTLSTTTFPIAATRCVRRRSGGPAHSMYYVTCFCCER